MGIIEKTWTGNDSNGNYNLRYVNNNGNLNANYNTTYRCPPIASITYMKKKKIKSKMKKGIIGITYTVNDSSYGNYNLRYVANNGNLGSNYNATYGVRHIASITYMKRRKAKSKTKNGA